jgi:transposase-like protein
MLLLLPNAVKNCFNLTQKVIVLKFVFFMLTRPSFQSANSKRNGRIHNGKQKRYCKDCGRQFAQAPIGKVVSQRDKALINKLLLLLLEKIALAGVARAANFSQSGVANRHPRFVRFLPRRFERRLPRPSKYAGALGG